MAVPYGTSADGHADTSLQINAPTTLATMLVEQQIAAGRTAATVEHILAKADMSALLLRALGWQTAILMCLTPLSVLSNSNLNWVSSAHIRGR